jgi:hypothetical protein
LLIITPIATPLTTHESDHGAGQADDKASGHFPGNLKSSPTISTSPHRNSGVLSTIVSRIQKSKNARRYRDHQSIHADTSINNLSITYVSPTYTESMT